MDGWVDSWMARWIDGWNLECFKCRKDSPLPAVVADLHGRAGRQVTVKRVLVRNVPVLAHLPVNRKLVHLIRIGAPAEEGETLKAPLQRTNGVDTPKFQRNQKLRYAQHVMRNTVKPRYSETFNEKHQLTGHGQGRSCC